MEVCQRLNLGLKTSPPVREPLQAGSLLQGVPFDPVLASVYARLGHAAFATKVIGLVLTQSNDEAHRLEEKAKWWRENYGFWRKLYCQLVGIVIYAIREAE